MYLPSIHAPLAARSAAVVTAAGVAFAIAAISFDGVRASIVFEALVLLAVATVIYARASQRNAPPAAQPLALTEIHLPDTGALPELDEEIEDVRRTVISRWPVFMH